MPLMAFSVLVPLRLALPGGLVAMATVIETVITSSTVSITVAIATNPPGNASLSGTRTLNAINGIATFNNLSIDLTGTGYTLSATSSGLTSGMSAVAGFRIN